MEFKAWPMTENEKKEVPKPPCWWCFGTGFVFDGIQDPETREYSAGPDNGKPCPKGCEGEANDGE